jgi:hypothetical protein
VTHRLEITSAAVDGGAETVAPHSLGLTRKTTTVQATAQSLPISVLDLVPTRPGEPGGGAIARSVDLARHVERLGYRRYWVAEHHAIQGLVCSATPVLIGHIAAATKTIRVGSGGVMLPNHAPLVVAEQFGTLETIYPGRIDLGLGRASGGDFRSMRARPGCSEHVVKSLWRLRGKFLPGDQQTVDRATQMSACHAGGRGFGGLLVAGE